MFTAEEEQQILQAIQQAELNTSGEIRLHVEPHCKKEVLDRAANVFAELKMHKTKLRNGVLFYMALEDHQFAILGDQGINKEVPTDFWDNIKEAMVLLFKQGDIAAGLSKGIEMAGEQLQQHFPYQRNDVNELDDAISYGK